MNKFLFNRIQISQGSDILDLGCAAGKRNNWMRNIYRYQGIDLLYSGINIERVDMRAWLKTNKKKYDLIIAEFSLQQISRKEVWGVLKNIKRALKPGGYFHISSFNKKDEHGPSFSNEEYLKIIYPLKEIIKRERISRDMKKRIRHVTDILSQKSINT